MLEKFLAQFEEETVRDAFLGRVIVGTEKAVEVVGAAAGRFDEAAENPTQLALVEVELVARLHLEVRGGCGAAAGYASAWCLCRDIDDLAAADGLLFGLADEAGAAAWGENVFASVFGGVDLGAAGHVRLLGVRSWLSPQGVDPSESVGSNL